MSKYEVLSDAPVKEGRSLVSKPLGKLGAGAIVTEAEMSGERMKYTKVSGSGPASGWVSVKLLAAATDKPAAPASYKSTSMLAAAEAEVEAKGPQSVLAEASKTGSDSIKAAVAALVLGLTDDATASANQAMGMLAGNKDGEGSALLVLAAAELASGLAKEALTHATAAMTLFKEAGDKQMEASALTTCANARLQTHETAAAATNAKEALSIFRDIADPDGEAAALSTLTDAYTATQGPAKAMKGVSSDAFAYFDAKGNKKGAGEAKLTLATSLMSGEGDDPKEAVKAAKEAAALFKTAGDKKLEAAALQTVSAALLNSDGDADEAFTAAQDAVAAYSSAGDKKGQATALVASSNAATVKGDYDKAVSTAKDAQKLFKELGSKAGEGSALHSLAAANKEKGDLDAAVIFLQDALSAYKGTSDKAGEASALQTGASIFLAKGGDDGVAEAVKMATDAMSLFRYSGNTKGEATTLQMLATMNLSLDGGGMDALMAAERARSIFLMIGDKKNQGLASHAAAQGHMLIGDYDFGIQSAMQAVVLARDAGDKAGEANALHTATNGMIAKGRYGEAVKMAKECEKLFADLGSKEMEEASQIMVAKIEAAIPARSPGPRTMIQPMDDARLGGQRSLFQENPNAVIWAPPINQHTYLMYCLELLKLVDDLKNQSSKTSIICATQGAFARQTGEIVPSQLEGTFGMTIFAVVRTVRLESPRLHISSVDVPPASTAFEIAECLRAAMIDSGTRNEISYTLDRKGKIAKSVAGRQ